MTDDFTKYEIMKATGSSQRSFTGRLPGMESIQSLGFD